MLVLYCFPWNVIGSLNKVLITWYDSLYLLRLIFFQNFGTQYLYPEFWFWSRFLNFWCFGIFERPLLFSSGFVDYVKNIWKMNRGPFVLSFRWPNLAFIVVVIDFVFGRAKDLVWWLLFLVELQQLNSVKKEERNDSDYLSEQIYNINEKHVSLIGVISYSMNSRLDFWIQNVFQYLLRQHSAPLGASVFQKIFRNCHESSFCGKCWRLVCVAICCSWKLYRRFFLWGWGKWWQQLESSGNTSCFGAFQCSELGE